MMRTRIKICGITRVKDARAALSAGADALGFVFWKGSPRQIAPKAAGRIIRDVPALVPCVGVFVNPSVTEVKRAIELAGLDAIQLHGDEHPAMFAGLGATVIKAVSLSTAADVRRARALPADVTLLVDARDAIRRGGTGRVANWSLARSLARHRPILLAGGIGPENIDEAIRSVRPWGVDLSSSVESRPGVKNARKIVALFKAARRADGKRADSVRAARAHVDRKRT
jgi:phosphoribosylanthranilate isomerase